MVKGLLGKIFRSKKRIVIVVIVLLILGFLVRKYIFPSIDGPESTRIEKGTVREELILSGEVKADEHASLAFQTSGELDFLGVTEGERVEKGQVLARLDTTNLYQAYLQADADLRRYQATLDKTYDEVKGHEKDESYTQRETRILAETNRDKAYRAYVSAQQNLANATLSASFNGIVTSITYPFTGINTVFSQPQIEILNPDTIYFEVSADQTEVIRIKEEQKVIIILDSFSEEEYLGKVEFIALTPKEGEVGAIYKVKARFENPNKDKFRVGMTGDAKFILSEVSDVLYVTPKFVNSDSKGKYVQLGRKNNKVYIEVGLEGEERVEVRGNVKEGDLVYD